MSSEPEAAVFLRDDHSEKLAIYKADEVRLASV